MSAKDIKKIFEKHHISPKKYLGQNFLVDKHAVNKVIKAANLNKNDTVLEIGSGLGALTRELSLWTGRVIAVEKDVNMVGILREELGDTENIELIQGDILKPDTRYQILNTKYQIVANLPYAIVGPVIRKFLESEHPPEAMILMVQKEVAQRICAKPPKTNLLAVSVQIYATPKIAGTISKNAFWPKPKVDSAILSIADIHKPKDFNAQKFFLAVKAGFAHPRKQLVNNFAEQLNMKKPEVETWLKKSSIKPTQRAETLAIQDWESLARTLAA